MASIRQLKVSVDKVADTAKKLQGTLKTFEDKNTKELAAAKKALDGTGTGADAEVKAALDEASKAIADASAKLADAERKARDYAAKL